MKELIMKELYCLGRIVERFDFTTNVNYEPMQFSFNRNELEEIADILNNKFPEREYHVFEISKVRPAWTKEDVKRFKKKQK